MEIECGKPANMSITNPEPCRRDVLGSVVNLGTKAGRIAIGKVKALCATERGLWYVDATGAFRAEEP